jgi:hypothetical protein
MVGARGQTRAIYEFGARVVASGGIGGWGMSGGGGRARCGGYSDQVRRRVSVDGKSYEQLRCIHRNHVGAQVHRHPGHDVQSTMATYTCARSAPNKTYCRGTFLTDDGRFGGRSDVTVTWSAGRPIAMAFGKC